jgi:hypothetical protein
MTIALEKAIQKSMTRPRRSVHHRSFLRALCQAIVRFTTQRFPSRRLKNPFMSYFSDPHSASERFLMYVHSVELEEFHALWLLGPSSNLGHWYGMVILCRI